MSDNLRVVITGASGLLGRAVYEEFKKHDYNVIGTAFSRSDENLAKLDLTNLDDLKEFFAQDIDVIVHCAAERRPDEVQKNAKLAKKLNENTPRVLADIAKEKNIFLIYISTDYVFDGKNPPYETDDVPNPINDYGISKLNGEVSVVDSGLENYVILRIPVLYGKIAYLGEGAVDVLLKSMIKNIQDKKNHIQIQPTQVDHSQQRFPTNTQDVARVLRDIVGKRFSGSGSNIKGIAHFSAKDQMTKYDMCNIFAKYQNAALADFVIPVDPATAKPAVDRPHNTQLTTKKLESWGINTSYINFEEWWEKAISENNFMV